MENKTVSTPTLNEKIRLILLENNEWDADSAAWQINQFEAANSIEKLFNELQTTPPTDIVDEEFEFLEYISNERDSFVSFINGLKWNTQLRSRVESIIIAYDQLKERYKAVLQSTKQFTLEQGREFWKAGQEYWKTSGASITFEELSEKMIPSLSKELGKKVG